MTLTKPNSANMQNISLCVFREDAVLDIFLVFLVRYNFQS